MVTIFPWQFSHENYCQTLVFCPDLLPARCSQHPSLYVVAGCLPPVPWFAVLGALGKAKGGEVETSII